MSGLHLLKIIDAKWVITKEDFQEFLNDSEIGLTWEEWVEFSKRLTVIESKDRMDAILKAVGKPGEQKNYVFCPICDSGRFRAQIPFCPNCANLPGPRYEIRRSPADGEKMVFDRWKTHFLDNDEVLALLNVNCYAELELKTKA